jgi:hypothetical protein
MNDRNSPFCIGKTYLIQTVTTYWAGKINSIYPEEIVLEDSCFIGWLGSFNDCISGKVKNYEKIPKPVIIGRGSIVSVIEIDKIPENNDEELPHV